MSEAERLRMITEAVELQAQDGSMWAPCNIHEAYVTQSLRWLHRVIEEGDKEALAEIKKQSEEH